MNNSALNPENSPNGTSDNNNGVRKLNNKPLMIVFGIVVLVIFGLVYALYARVPNENISSVSNKGNKHIDDNNAMVNKLTAGIGDGILDYNNEPTASTTQVIVQEKIVEKDSIVPPNTETPLETVPVDEEAQRIAQKVREFRERNYYEALVSRTAIENSEQFSNTDAKSRRMPENPALQRQALLNRLLASQGQNNQQIDSNKSFSQEQDPYKYSTSVRIPQLTPYEIRVGTIIPAIMVSGINSDLPGEIIAQVSHDVRDSKTGKFVLIPQGSKLIGRYNSQVKMGQERVMIAWHRIQFPDSSVFSLGNMGAVDLAGYAGMSDEVNNHTWSLFKNAFLLSVVGAGTQIMVKNDGSSATAELKKSLGQQYGQLGIQMIRQRMQVKPTLEIRPGYRFNVMVNKDLILQPYKN